MTPSTPRRELPPPTPSPWQRERDAAPPPPAAPARAAYFAAGLLAAAVPLLAAIEKLAEQRQALQVVMDVIRQVGWPGVLVIVGALLLRQQAADHRTALQLIGEELAGAVRRLVEAQGKVEKRASTTCTRG